MVMNNKKTVFGVVENIDYSGVQTDTAKVSVDNVNREIKVDVDFSGMLGETNKTAYPGHEGKLNRKLIIDVEEQIAAETSRAKGAERDLEEIIQDVAWDITVGDSRILTKLNDETTRATAAETQLQKHIEEVSQQLVDSDTATEAHLNDLTVKLAQQSEELSNIVDEVNNSLSKDISNNKESIEQLKNVDSEIHQSIEQIENLYAQKEWVEGKEYLTEVKAEKEYAKLTDIPDVSEFIEEIPSEYITEDELEAKQYLTSSTAQKDFATKTYLKSEIAKLGTLFKQIVESVDLETNSVVVEGVTRRPDNNVIYLVSSPVINTYQQYTLINDILTFIGNIKTDQDSYATVSYVNSLITDINFIDGGTARQFITT